MLVVDGSESVGSGNFDVLREAVIILTRQFPIGSDAVLMGLIQFSNRVDVEVNLTSIDNAAAMESAINGLVYQGGSSTFTSNALEEAFAQFQTFGRQEVRRQIILLTDGEPQDRNRANNIATMIKEQGITITTIAINIQTIQAQRNLQDISSDDTLIEANNVNELEGLVSTIVETTCPG